jgi:hypothetical protein
VKRLVFTLVATVVLSLGCDDGIKINPAMPSQIEPIQVGPFGDPADGGTKRKVDLSMWSPYIVVHTPGEALRAYQQAIPELMAAGALRGVRIGIVKGESRNFVNTWIASAVPDVLWILDNYYLFDPNIEDVIDQVFIRYPTIRYLQIGNETTTILPKTGPQISIETYLSVFKRINAYVQRRYPGVILLTQSTFGSGDYGSVELERMIELGLKEISPRPVIAMNVYSVSTANQYSYVLNSSLRGYRVWVTETGINDPARHISYVQQMYPVLRDILRAERIYWYCMYCGETGSHAGFGLIKDIMAPTIWKSDLYQALVTRRSQ